MKKSTIKIPNKLLTFFWGYVVFSLVLFSSYILYSAIGSPSFADPIAELVLTYIMTLGIPFLLTILIAILAFSDILFLIPFILFYFGLFLYYSYLVITKSTVSLKKSRVKKFIILVTILLLPLGFILPQSLRYPIKIEREYEEFVEQNKSQLTPIYYHFFDQAKQCAPQLINDQSIYADRFKYQPNKADYLQCLNKIAQKIDHQLPLLKELKRGRALVFVRLKDQTTLEILGLNGKIFQIKRPNENPTNNDPNNNIHFPNIETLFLILEGRKSAHPTYLDSWRTLFKDFKKTKSIYHYFAHSGVRFLGPGEYEVVVPLKNKQDEIIGSLLIFYND